jgi:hypothetical protein
MKPTVGRVVHYYFASNAKGVPYHGPYAAVVCATSAENDRLKGDLVATLKVFDPPDSGSGKGADHYFTANYSEAPAAGCWSWPPRV